MYVFHFYAKVKEIVDYDTQYFLQNASELQANCNGDKLKESMR